EGPYVAPLVTRVIGRYLGVDTTAASNVRILLPTDTAPHPMQLLPGPPTEDTTFTPPDTGLPSPDTAHAAPDSGTRSTARRGRPRPRGVWARHPLFRRPDGRPLLRGDDLAQAAHLARRGHHRHRPDVSDVAPAARVGNAVCVRDRHGGAALDPIRRCGRGYGCERTVVARDRRSAIGATGGDREALGRPDARPLADGTPRGPQHAARLVAPLRHRRRPHSPRSEAARPGERDGVHRHPVHDALLGRHQSFLARALG